MEEEKKKLLVSDSLIEIYKYLNAVDMSERINQLSELEKYILIALSLDNHDIKNVIVRENLLPYKEIGQAIYDAMEELGTNEIIEQLIELTGDKYIDLSVLVDSDVDVMPEPANQSEIRDWRLKLLD